jgi:aminoglycoside N3'-acetyltransferase
MDERRRTERWLNRLTSSPLGAATAALLPAPVKAAVRAVLRSPLGAPVEARLTRSAERAQAVAQPAVTRAMLARDLDRLGLPDRPVVFVHASLSRLGYVEGGAATVVEALEALVVERLGGTLAMPAFTMAGSMAATLRGHATFDVRTTPSGMGAITEAFRRRSGVERSLHPTHSVAAKGPLARWLTEGHHLDPRSFGPHSPFGRLLEAERGWLLGVGTDLGPVTFYHVLEDLDPGFPRRVYTLDSPLAATCLDRDGTAHRVAVHAHDPDCAAGRIDRPEGAWIRARLTAEMEARGLSWQAVGAGRAWTMTAPAMYAGLAELLAQGLTIYTSEAEARVLGVATGPGH